MKKNNAGNNMMKVVTEKILKTVLYVDANTASCTLMHQPQAPDSLLKYKNKKHEKK